MVYIRKRGLGIYEEYLKTAKWQEKRRIILNRANGHCERCGTAARLDVHHLTYKNIGEEKLDELVALCRRCHKKQHNYFNEEDLIDAGF